MLVSFVFILRLTLLQQLPREAQPALTTMMTEVSLSYSPTSLSQLSLLSDLWAGGLEGWQIGVIVACVAVAVLAGTLFIHLCGT